MTAGQRVRWYVAVRVHSGSPAASSTSECVGCYTSACTCHVHAGGPHGCGAWSCRASQSATPSWHLWQTHASVQATLARRRDAQIPAWSQPQLHAHAHHPRLIAPEHADVHAGRTDGPAPGVGQLIARARQQRQSGICRPQHIAHRVEQRGWRRPGAPQRRAQQQLAGQLRTLQEQEQVHACSMH
jgi:hypothetical protein